MLHPYLLKEHLTMKMYAIENKNKLLIETKPDA